MVAGEFEIHLTVSGGWQTGGVAAFAERHGLKYSDIVLERGTTPRQEMLTTRASGTLLDMRRLALDWDARLKAEHLWVSRVKIEAAPWNEGVPQTDAEAADAGDDQYWEHHVKLLLPDIRADLMFALIDVAVPLGAHLSRNARRRREDGAEERFVTQRCHGVGRESAQASLAELLHGLRALGHQILEVEEEYVVADSRLALDDGWITPSYSPDYESPLERRQRSAVAGAVGYPPTYRPVEGEGVEQSGYFDPALKQYSHAYSAGEPSFADDGEGRAWRAARRAAMEHVLSLIAASPWRDHLVLRGSVTLRAWFGEAAREPHDLDFVVVPHTMTVDASGPMLDGIVAAVVADPGPGLRGGEVAVTDIWTYDRVPGRRLVFPFTGPGGRDGSVQLDFVFNEELPVAAEPLDVPGVGTVLAATPGLSLAWKIMWLENDGYPQGKDLYDAVLLAEHTRVPMSLVREVLDVEEFTAWSVMRWDVDWANFRDAYPAVTGTREEWLRRLAVALED